MKSRPRRILFVTIARYLPRAISGDVVSTDALCLRLAAAGHEPIVVCAAEPEPLDPGTFARPYPIIRLPDPLAGMMEMVPRLEPDAVVARGPQPAAAAAHWAVARRRRLHVYFTSIAFAQGFPPPERSSRLRYAANSPFLVHLAAALVGKKVVHVPPLIEPERYRCDPAGDAILFVNPVAAKGAHLVAAIAERLPHRRFLVVRAWPDLAAHRHVAMPFANIEWAESAADMRPIYAQTRLVLMPSIWEETFGRVVIEAQISGIPTIASDRGGLKATVGAGGIVLPFDAPVERWCETIEMLMNDGRRHASLSAAAKRRTARSDLRPEAVMARFLDFVDS
ncbi:MAG: glycosyltransferase [Rhodospirillaceae bacterium]|nr:glycosyltransferase [Rhodospirillaceae bacterium]